MFSPFKFALTLREPLKIRRKGSLCKYNFMNESENDQKRDFKAY